MKYLIFLSFFSLSFLGNTQELECCESFEEVEKALIGKWRLVGDKSNTIYKFWKNDDEEFIYMAKANRKGKFKKNKAVKARVVAKENNKFFMLFTYFKPKKMIFGSYIKKLNDNYFSYNEGKVLKNFVKIKN